MILDAGIATVYRVFSDAAPGDMASEQREKLFTAWFGYRNVGFSRYFTAQQVNAKVDALVRILRPRGVTLNADDLCVLRAAGEPDNTYRILQVQYTRDEDAGEEVADLTLQRIEEKYDD